VLGDWWDLNSELINGMKNLSLKFTILRLTSKLESTSWSANISHSFRFSFAEQVFWLVELSISSRSFGISEISGFGHGIVGDGVLKGLSRWDDPCEVLRDSYETEL